MCDTWDLICFYDSLVVKQKLDISPAPPLKRGHSTVSIQHLQHFPLRSLQTSIFPVHSQLLLLLSPSFWCLRVPCLFMWSLSQREVPVHRVSLDIWTRLGCTDAQSPSGQMSSCTVAEMETPGLRWGVIVLERCQSALKECLLQVPEEECVLSKINQTQKDTYFLLSFLEAKISDHRKVESRLQRRLEQKPRKE